MKWSGGLLVVVLLCMVWLTGIGYDIGVTAGRQSVEAVACEANVDSVIVHPVRQPRGRVP